MELNYKSLLEKWVKEQNEYIGFNDINDKIKSLNEADDKYHLDWCYLNTGEGEWEKRDSGLAVAEMFGDNLLKKREFLHKFEIELDNESDDDYDEYYGVGEILVTIWSK